MEAANAHSGSVATFKTRVDDTFAALFSPSSGASFWSVSDRGIAPSGLKPSAQSRGRDEEVEVSGGSDDGDEGIDAVDDHDEEEELAAAVEEEEEGHGACAAQYERFVRLVNSRRRGRGETAGDLEAASGKRTGAVVKGLGEGGIDREWEEDLEELESDEEDGEEDADEEDDDVRRRVGKRKKIGEWEGQEKELRFRAEESPVERRQEKLEQEDLEDDDEEVRQMRQMVGMDETLDFEEEEDEYDKVAVGREGSEDRIFMGQVKDFSGTNINLVNSLPSSLPELRQTSRDARANHKAALARLEEDDREAAAAIAGVQVVDTSIERSHSKQQLIQTKLEMCLVSGRVRGHKSSKRVRFAIAEDAENERKAGRISGPHSNNASASQEPVGSQLDPVWRTDLTSSSGSVSRRSQVPDYVKHPWKYIQYTIDWSEQDDDKQNLAAFHAMRDGSSPKVSDGTPVEQQSTVEVHKPIRFTPRSLREGNVKERQDEIMKSSSDQLGIIHAVESGDRGLSLPMSIAAGLDLDRDQGGGGSSESEKGASSSSPNNVTADVKPGRIRRQYRSKGNTSDESDGN
ncbi:unnamed protein product [Sphagnum jensenii]|uniref:U5 small nuclear ribonucleoprotein TSSC4 n=1 Tax=Sphagnum jensenii TaxID=128206 RepID=A0ABP1AGL5_9BRYO